MNFNELKKLAEEGIPEAQYNLGLMYAKGTAFQVIRKAIDQLPEKHKNIITIKDLNELSYEISRYQLLKDKDDTL